MTEAAVIPWCRTGEDSTAGRREQFRWAVKIRWLAIAGFLALGTIAAAAGVVVDLLPCLLAAALASLLNALNAVAVRHWRGVDLATTAAVAGDVILITFLVVQTGGAQSPFVAMYPVQVLAAALLVEVWVAMACAGAAALALAVGILGGGADAGVRIESAAFLPAWLAFFAFGLAVVAYVGGHVARQLRGRERELGRSNAELRAALCSVEAGNRELRATCDRLEQAERQLAQSEKMRALGDFVAGVAHELNNPIAIVTANLQILAADLAPERDPEVAEALRDCGEAAARAARIVADLRQFSHSPNDHRWEEADLNDRIKRTVRLARHLFGPGVEIELALGELPRLRILTAEIDQLLLNLLSNAARAVGDSGVVRVSTAVVERAARGVRRGVAITVADDGPGVPPEIVDRIFEPFFTTRPEGQGVGLGLSLAFAIAERHGGFIEVASAPGEGAIFEVVLGLADCDDRASQQDVLDSTDGACG